MAVGRGDGVNGGGGRSELDAAVAGISSPYRALRAPVFGSAAGGPGATGSWLGADAAEPQQNGRDDHCQLGRRRTGELYRFGNGPGDNPSCFRAIASYCWRRRRRRCWRGPDLPLDPNVVQGEPAGRGPLSLVSADWGESRAAARGGALVVDLHSTLTFKNTSVRRVRGVSLLVLAQEVTPGGKASVTVPSLDVPPGETFAVRVDLRLMRPLALGAGALVEVGLDGVLFEDLVFYGPNRLQAKRAMVAWEMEARRDRRAMLAALETGGRDALQQKLLAVLARATGQSGGVQMARTMPSTNVEAGRNMEFAFLQMPESPVELLSGSAQMDGAEARSPRIEVRNRSNRAVRYVELGWLARDGQGASLPAARCPPS